MKISRTTNRNRGHGGPSKQPANKKVFARYMQEKLAVTVLVIMLALFALILILYRIIDENNTEYTRIVLSQRSTYDSRVIPYRRGDIVDRNGTCLATSDKVYNLIIDPVQIYEKEELFLDPTVNALVEVFGYDRNELLEVINDNRESRYLRYERKLTYDKKEAFETVQKSVNEANYKNGVSQRVRGVWFEDEYKRIYPYNSLACGVIGFTSSDGSEGNGGIEQYYNSTLTGVNGREYGYLNDDTDLEAVIKPAQNGNTVMSTIDVYIQQIVEDKIAEWENVMGSKHIGVIVMDPGSGEILAMASNSKYDLNNPRDLSLRYTQEEIDHMSDSDKVEALSQMWRNFCVSDTFEPGSPSKVLTVATGLEENIFQPTTHFECDGFEYIGGYEIGCTARLRGGHGDLTLEETLIVSCNDAMMHMAAMEGKTIFKKYQDMFNFGSKTGIDLPGEADAASLVYRVDNMDPTSLATNAFGQNFNCTMVQMAAAFASAINGGSYYEPHVVKQVLNEHGAVIQKKGSVLVRETVSDSTSRFLREALRRTVAEGTGKAAQVEGYQIGGKTGTAEKTGRNKKDYVVSFCGFAPTEHPEVLVYVVIDEPNTDDQAHSTYASQVFSQIMGEILPYLNVFPDALDGESDPLVPDPVTDSEGINGGGEDLPEETEPARTYETEEYVPEETGEDGSPLPSGLPDLLSGTETGAEGLPESPAETGESRSAGKTREETRQSQGAGETVEETRQSQGAGETREETSQSRSAGETGEAGQGSEESRTAATSGAR